MTYTLPRRRTILQCSQIRLTLDRIFMVRFNPLPLADREKNTPDLAAAVPSPVRVVAPSVSCLT
jgi:hypothetical protein